jgi:phosphomannomutase
MEIATKEAPHAFLAKPYRYIDIDGLKILFRDGSWVLLRASGTEELLRIHSEAREGPRARAFGESGRELLARSVEEAGRATA